MISFEQRPSDSLSLNARIAKKYEVLGSRPVIVADGLSTVWFAPREHEFGSSVSTCAASASSEGDSSELAVSSECFP